MELTQLRTQIHVLSRRDKYRLIQFIVQDLAEEDTAAGEIAVAIPAGYKSVKIKKSETPKAQAIDTFLRKWKGCLKGVDPESAKHRYLEEKYG